MRVTFTESLAVSRSNPDLIALDEALDLLSKQDERKARVVELRFFGGLTMSAIEIIHTLRERGVQTRHPLEVVIWQNEEGGLIWSGWRRRGAPSRGAGAGVRPG